MWKSSCIKNNIKNRKYISLRGSRYFYTDMGFTVRIADHAAWKERQGTICNLGVYKYADVGDIQAFEEWLKNYIKNYGGEA